LTKCSVIPDTNIVVFDFKTLLYLTVATFLSFLPLSSVAEDAHPAKSLTAQASDPNAPLIQLSFTNLYAPEVYNSSGTYNYFQIQPVVPVPKGEGSFPGQVIRPTLPFFKLPDGTSGLGDINLVHLFIPDLKHWGSWGLGYTFTAPTAVEDELGQGKWQIGPAASLLYYGIKNWQLGGLVTNTVSFAGDDNRSDVNVFTYQPILNHMFGDWYLGIGDLVWEHDWNDGGGWTIPLGLQLGRITKIGKHNYNLSAEIVYTATRQDENLEQPEWGFRLGIVILLPE